MSSAVVERPDLVPSPRISKADEWRRLATLSWTLALTDWKLRFYGSVLGLAWTLVRPFALFGVIYFVFTEIAGLDKNVHNYGLYILFALVLFTFFSEMTGTAVQALVFRESLLRKMQFNPVAIPLAITITAMLNLGTTLLGVLIFCIGAGLYPMLTWLELPVLVVLLAMFGTGVGMLLSVAFVRFRDIQPIWDVVAQILFYASAILYVAVPTVPNQYLQEFLCNPLAAINTQMRHAMVDNDAASITSAFTHPVYVLIPLAIIVGTFVLGVFVFQRESPRIAEHL